jgi:GH25 family lysozyme M1 (1,4-beta-N-acetylmuramidase)
MKRLNVGYSRRELLANADISQATAGRSGNVPDPLNVVIDISHHNGNVNLAKAKEDGILGVIATVPAKELSLCLMPKIYPSLFMVRDQERVHHQPKRTSHMDQSLEKRIRERAYHMWIAHGCEHGQAEQHWLTAEREVLATSTAVLGGNLNLKKKPRSSARSKAARTLARAG